MDGSTDQWIGPPSDSQLVFIDVQAAYTGSAAGIFRLDLRPQVLNAAGDAHDADAQCYPPEALSDADEISPGAVIHGTLCWTVPLEHTPTELTIEALDGRGAPARFHLSGEVRTSSADSIAASLRVNGLPCPGFTIQPTLPEDRLTLEAASCDASEGTINIRMFASEADAGVYFEEVWTLGRYAEGTRSHALFGDRWMVQMQGAETARRAQQILGGRLIGPTGEVIADAPVGATGGGDQ